MIAAGSTCGVQKIGWMSAELRGSATKSQPPLGGELARCAFAQTPNGDQLPIGFPVVWIAPQKLPGKITGCQRIDVVVSGL
jgi:hypothetical protein